MTYPWHKGQSSTPENPGNSTLMRWIRDALAYKGDDCLFWPFGRDGRGYGTFGRKGKSIKVHRYICRRVHGDPPSPKHHAAHSCGNGHLACATPNHVSWQTPQQNYKDSRPHPRFKLTPEAVREIRKSAGGTKEIGILAARYDVSERTIRKVLSGQTWKTGERPKLGFAVKPYRKPARSPLQPD